MRCPRIILDWIVICSLAACMPSNSNVSAEMTQMVVTTMTAKPVVATQGAVPTLISTQIPDIEINTRQFNQIIDLKLGQVLKVEPPSFSIEWRVDYDPALFELLTSLEIVRAPGPAGWLFRAIATGEGQIVLTSIVSCSEPPCPLMPMRSQLVVHIK